MNSEHTGKVGFWLMATALASVIFPLLIPIPIILAIYLWLNKTEPLNPKTVNYQHRNAAEKKVQAAENINTDLWQNHWLNITESPVERLFLQTLIKELHLRPQGEYLINSWLTIEPQKIIGRYRVDFLFITKNEKRHVVEIDGAAYHSSRSQLAYDSERDVYISNFGYVIIRIPAAEVLNNVEKSVSILLKKILS